MPLIFSTTLVAVNVTTVRRSYDAFADGKA